MSATFIAINTGQRLGGQLRNAVDQFRNSRDQLGKLLAVMQTQVDDPLNPVDVSLLEQQFGLQAGEGARVFSLVTNVVGLLPDPKVNLLLNQLG